MMLEQIWSSLVADLTALFERGGPVIFVLAVLSVAALSIVISKLWQFHRRRVGGHRFIAPVLRLWRRGNGVEAVRLLEDQSGPAARVMLVAAGGIAQPHSDQGLLREEVARVAQLELSTLRAGLRGLEIISQIAPLLGLLGTVLGMITAFQAMQEAGSNVDPALLAGGIWTALVTTAAGLIVAIPAAAAHYYLDGRLEREREAMENAATALFTGVNAEAEAALKPVAAGRRIKRAS